MAQTVSHINLRLLQVEKGKFTKEVLKHISQKVCKLLKGIYPKVYNPATSVLLTRFVENKKDFTAMSTVGWLAWIFPSCLRLMCWSWWTTCCFVGESLPTYLNWCLAFVIVVCIWTCNCNLTFNCILTCNCTLYFNLYFCEEIICCFSGESLSNVGVDFSSPAKNWDKYILRFETNTVCDLRQIHFGIWKKYILVWGNNLLLLRRISPHCRCWLLSSSKTSSSNTFTGNTFTDNENNTFTGNTFNDNKNNTFNDNRNIAFNNSENYNSQLRLYLTLFIRWNPF